MPLGFINALDWAYGDGVNDDANALNLAASEANADQIGLWLPKGTYDIGTTVTIPAGIDVIGNGVIRLKSSFSKTAPAVRIGSSGSANLCRNIEIEVDDAGAVSWSSADSAAVEFINPQSCKIVVRRARGCTTGVLVSADVLAVANEIRVGLLQDCRYGVRFVGQVRDNLLMSGRWSLAHSQDIERSMWKIDSTSASGNTWILPSSDAPRFSSSSSRRLSYLHTVSGFNRTWGLGDDSGIDVSNGDAHLVADGASAQYNLIQIGRHDSGETPTIVKINSAPSNVNAILRRRDEAANQTVLGGVVT